MEYPVYKNRTREEVVAAFCESIRKKHEWQLKAEEEIRKIREERNPTESNPRRAAPKATAHGRPPSLSLPPSPATLKFPQKPQEYREIVVSLHRRNS